MKIFLTLSLFLTIILSNGIIAKSQEIDRIIAIIDDEVIMLNELKNYILKSGEKTKVNEIAHQQKMLKKLVIKKLTERFLKKNNAAVSEKLIDIAIQQIAKNNKISVAQLLKQLPSQNISVSDLRDKIKSDIEQTKLRQILIKNNTTVSQIELEREMKITLKTLNVSTEPASYHVGHIVVADEDTAKEISEKLAEGEQFTTLARVHSRVSSNLFGGILGWQTLDELPQNIQEKLDKMTVGQIKIFSDDNRSVSKDRWNIIQLFEIKNNQQDINDRVRSLATQSILQRKLDRYLDKLLNKIRKDSYIEIRL